MIINCVRCKLEWNVSDFAVIPKGGYLCPACRRERERKERERFEQRFKKRRGRMGVGS